MKKLICFAALVAALTITSFGQQQRATFTGTALIYGTGLSTRVTTRPFTLILNGRSSDADVARLLEARQSGGQDALVRELGRADLGRFSFSGNVGVPVGAVFVDQQDNNTLIRVMFSRRLSFGELRWGLRSTDYPFGYLEFHVDAQGRGDGMILPAAMIRVRDNKFVIDDFGTFPGRLMGVRLRSGSVSSL